MSQENVEAVRLSIEAYRRGDWLAATAYLAPDVIWEVGQELPAQGPAAVRDMWQRWTSDWEELEMVGEELIDAGDERRRRHALAGAVADAAESPIDGWVFEVSRLPGRPVRTEGQEFETHSRPGPRSRGAVGVGDVAGERGDRPSRSRRLERPGHRSGAGADRSRH